MELTASEVAERLAARVVGNGEVRLRGLAPLANADGDRLSHLSSPAYRRFLTATHAGAVLCRAADAAAVPTVALIVDDPYVAYAIASHWFASPADTVPGIAASADIASDAHIASTATIGPGAVIGAGSVIDDHAVIGAHAVVGRLCRIGAQSRLHPRVTLYDDVVIGARCILHSGAVIGADGFGFARARNGSQHKIAQLGGVRIGDDVEVGANTTIDRGAIESTVIEDGVKIDNQVQIGHNCHIGAHSLICGCVGIVGSTRIGSHCVLAGGVGVGGGAPIELGNGVVVSGMTHVAQSLPRSGVYSGGTVVAPTREWKRNALRLRELEQLVRRVRALERAASSGPVVDE